MLVELLMLELEVLLGAAVLEVEDWETTLGSVDGIGFPSLVCNFTTYRNNAIKYLADLINIPPTF